jgi:tetratricopeptide (TPR) repeat protein
MAAASIIVIATGIAGFYIYQVNPDKTYNSAYVDYTVAEQRGNDRLTEIEKAYHENNFTAVTQLANSRPVSAKEELLKGLSYMKLNQVDSAIHTFQNIVQQNTIYKPDAEFYLALSFVKSKKYDDALLLMQKIRDDSSHLYHEYVSKKLIRETKILRWK